MNIEKELQDCINELCVYCGCYELEHLGACDKCRWYKIKLMSYVEKRGDRREE